MTKTFSARAWAANEPLYETILSMPFNAALADGTLEPARFRHYMLQDALYLEGFARALALISARAPGPDEVLHFSEAAQTAIIVERALHADYFQRFGISAQDAAATRPTPVCDHYVSYLLRVAALEPYETALGAVLPCFWIYREVGKHIHARSTPDNPWQAWIDTYAGADFDAAVDAVIGRTDAAAEQAGASALTAMHGAFTRAAQLEWMFWDSAWHQADWPV
ncbi:thiaminase II [Hyphomonadaceae bacterium BL14]|nr:thiaminase II [Hyphomonadaceae bacterium BL14]